MSNLIDYSGIVPLLFLAISNDADRATLADLYLSYRNLFIKVARRYFGSDDGEVEDAVAATAERMCKYSSRILSVPSKKIPAYMVYMVSNVCRDRIRELQSDKLAQSILADDEVMEQFPDSHDGYGVLFDRYNAMELLKSFKQLSAHDKELIWMRHVDRYSITEIAEQLGMSKTAVYTALSRAKKRLEASSTELKG